MSMGLGIGQPFQHRYGGSAFPSGIPFKDKVIQWLCTGASPEGLPLEVLDKISPLIVDPRALYTGESDNEFIQRAPRIIDGIVWLMAMFLMMWLSGTPL